MKTPENLLDRMYGITTTSIAPEGLEDLPRLSLYRRTLTIESIKARLAEVRKTWRGMVHTLSSRSRI